MIKLTTKIGKQMLEIELPKMKDVHKFNKIYGSLPTKCDNCQSLNVYISYMNPGGNDYFTMECGECGANANFGIHKEGRDLYWKGNKMKVYQPEENDQRSETEDPNKEDPYSARNYPNKNGVDDNLPW